MTTRPKKERAGGWVVLALLVGLAVLFGGGYAAAYYAAGDKVPRGTTVAGVDVGDRTVDQAAERLEERLAQRAEEPVEISIDGETVRVNPHNAGISVDYAESVADAGGGRSWHPGRIWHYFTGGTDHEPVVEVDEPRMKQVEQRLGKRFGSEPVNGTVTFDDNRVNTSDPEPGHRLDGDELAEAITTAWIDQDARTPTVELQRVTPEIDQSDVRRAVRRFANPALSGPVTLAFRQTEVKLAPRDFASVLGMRPKDGELAGHIKRKRLLGLVGEDVSPEEPVNATVRLVDGEPQVVPGKPGVEFKPEDVVKAFRTAVLADSGERRAEIPSSEAKPDFTTQDAEDLGIREQVSTFTTRYPHSEYRNVNIGRAAELIDGTVLKPGETFSMNDTVGERTAANGFTEGYIISDGILKEDYGGGVSQMATTLFNAMFFAGLEDVEHKPHSFYIDRYPVGREATLAWPVVDLRFRNDTDHGVLIHTTVTPSTPGSQGVVTATMYSTQVWDIDSVTSDRYNHREPDTRVIWDEPSCEEHTGWSGFDVDVTRIFKNPDTGSEVKRESFHTAYSASDHVECRTTPTEPPPDDGDDSGGGGDGQGGGGQGGD